MKKTYIEQMNSLDRNNSLRGYYNNLTSAYEKIRSELVDAKPDDSVNIDKWFTKKYISFAATMKKFIPEEKRGDNDDKYCGEEEFDAFKFQLSKNLNLIESLLRKLCHDSVDSSINEDSTIDEINQAVTWQFVDCVKVDKPAYQDIERIRQILKAHGEVNHLNFEKDDRTRGNILINYKKSLREMLKDMFNVLGNLVNFDQYLTVVEDMSAYQSSTKGDDMIYLKSKDQTKQILALTETVKALILEYLVGYVKIRSLNLPHSFLKEAKFTHSILNDGNFMSSELTDAVFRCSSMRSCDLSMCALDGIDAVGADMRRSTFNYSDLSGADFSSAVLKECSLNSVTLFDRRIVLKDTYYNINFVSGRVNFANGSENTPVECEEAVCHSYNSFAVNSWKEGDIVNNIIAKITRNTDNDLKRQTMDMEMDNLGELLKDFNNNINNAVEEYRVEYATVCPSPVFMNWAEKVYKEHNYNYNFEPAKLRNASITRASMPNTDMMYINMEGATFDDTDISSSRFFFNNSSSSRFSNSNAGNCKFYRGDFSNSTFFNANAINTEYIDCNLSGSSFENAMLIGAKFISTESDELFIEKLLNYTDGEFCVSDKEILTIKTEHGLWKDSVVSHADMQDCNMQNCVFSNGVFVGINLDRSVFSNADMKKSFIYNCLVRWADLYKVNLSYSLIMGTMFDHAGFNDSMLSNCRMFANVLTECNISKTNLVSCRFDNVVFINCDFSGANLSNSVFHNCVFKDCNFNQANLIKTFFNNCKFDSSNITSGVSFRFSIHSGSWIADSEERSRIMSIKNLSYQTDSSDEVFNINWF